MEKKFKFCTDQGSITALLKFPKLLLKFCTEHSSITDILCVKFQNVSEMDVMVAQVYVRFDFKIFKIFKMSKICNTAN